MTIHWPDLINGLFELLGALLMLMDCRRMYIDKGLHGVSVWPRVFFTSWGWWNLFFYPALGQWLSFWGGVLMIVVQMAWMGQYIYYQRRYPHGRPKTTA